MDSIPLYRLDAREASLIDAFRDLPSEQADHLWIVIQTLASEARTSAAFRRCVQNVVYLAPIAR